MAVINVNELVKQKEYDFLRKDTFNKTGYRHH